MRILILLIALLLSAFASAEVYRSLDENGNVVFTDQPSPDAEEVRIDKIQTIDPPEVEEFKYTPPKKSVETVYTELKITNPQNDEVFTGAEVSDINVSVEVEPALNAAQGDRLVVYLDGEKQADSTSTSFIFSDLERGTHTAKVDVVNKQGKALKSSAPVSFTIHRFSVLNPNRPPAPAP